MQSLKFVLYGLWDICSPKSWRRAFCPTLEDVAAGYTCSTTEEGYQRQVEYARYRLRRRQEILMKRQEDDPIQVEV